MTEGPPINPTKPANEAVIHDLGLRLRLKDLENIRIALAEARDTALQLLGVHATVDNPDANNIENAEYLKARITQIEDMQKSVEAIQLMLKPKGKFDEEYVRAFLKTFDEAVGISDA